MNNLYKTEYFKRESNNPTVVFVMSPSKPEAIAKGYPDHNTEVIICTYICSEKDII